MLNIVFLGLPGGLMQVLKGLDGYFVFHIFDKGFKYYLGGNMQTFFAILSVIEAAAGGRVRHCVPCDPNDPWLDQLGQAQPVPIAAPGTNRGNLLFDVQANSTRVYVTAHRWVAEANFGRDFGSKMTGSREEIPTQLLEPFGKEPTPQVSKIFVVNSIQDNE